MNSKPLAPPSPWDSAITLEPGKAMHITGDVARDYEKQSRDLREIRGKVLARTVEIEFALDKLLTELFFRGIFDEKIKFNFTSVILKQSRLALSKKIDFLKRVTKTLENKSEFEDVVKNLEKVSEVRNDFAHNVISFYPDEATNQLLPFFVHSDGKKEALNNAYLDGLNHLYSSTSTQIENLTTQLISVKEARK